MNQKRRTARQMAHEYIDSGDPLGWFDALYTLAEGDPGVIPWADFRPNANLIKWFESVQIRSRGKRALKIGCGLGDDAEALAERGFEVTAFDISSTAIEWCRRRFPDSRVDYQQQDLFHTPQKWHKTYDLVVESYTLQVLPPELRPKAQECISRLVVPGGTLLVICRGRDPSEDQGQMPWKIIKDELNRFESLGLKERSFEDFMDDEDPPVRRFRVVYERI